MYHGLANLVGLAFDDKQLEQARKGVYLDTEGRKLDPINTAALITRNKLLDMKAASLKKAKEMRDQTPDDFIQNYMVLLVRLQFKFLHM